VANGGHGLEHPKDILRQRGIRPRRWLGQNFLVSPAYMHRVVEAACISHTDVVLEIGTGLGRLTERLAERAAFVISVEVDRDLHAIASERLARLANVTLLCEDFLASKHEINPAVTSTVKRVAAARPVKAVGNLPYQISSPALINLLVWEVPVSETDVMLQAEVVERLTANPGTPQYGPLTVFAACRATVDALFWLPPSAFWPRPAVRSAFVRLSPRPPSTRARSPRTFSQVVNRLFQNRRKTLAHALRLGWGRDCERLVLEKLGLDPDARPGELGLAEFVKIANALTPNGAAEDGL